MNLAGVDLAWQSEKNPSAIAYGQLSEDAVIVSSIEPAVYGISDVLHRLKNIYELDGIAIDAPLIINNQEGQRPCENQIGKVYGSRYASCHTSNKKLYPDAGSVYLSEQLQGVGFDHLRGDRWQIECYPHPAIIELFELKERLKYKKGKVVEKRAGQKMLAAYLRRLGTSQVLRLIFADQNHQITDGAYIESLAGQALKTNEDALDAALCLYIAALYARNFNGQVFGDVDSGYIWVPQVVCF
jgi:predicted RNase H-like nuclease